MIHNLISGLTSLGNAQAIIYLLVGSIVGVLLGVIPGVGGIVLLTLVLAFISHISLIGAICLFLATQAASYFSASITSILLNTPAHPEAFAVTFDGFPMARRGEPGRALGISATATCIGGLVGCAIFVALLPFVNKLPVAFHPPELALLVTIAMLLIATLGSDSASKAIMSVAMGFMVAAIGPSPITGHYRYTFNATGLYAGVSLVALALGTFAIPQMILVYGTATTIARQDMLGRDVDAVQAVELNTGFGSQVIEGVRETLRHWRLTIQSGIIGVLTGIVPGIGGFAANFLSYGIAQQTSRRRSLFGTGIAEGIIAPEGASLAKEAGGLIPIIGLGLPGGVGSALFIAALAIKGVKVGFGFTQSYPSLPYQMIWIVALAGVIGTTIGLLAASTLARVTRVPGPALVPFMMVLAVVGPFISEVTFFSVMEMFVLSLVGFVLRRLRYSVASFAVGLVLASYLEQDVDLTANVYPHFLWLERPMSDVLLLIAVGILVAKIVQTRKAAAVTREQIRTKWAREELSRVQLSWLMTSELNPYPLLALVSSVAIVLLASAFLIYGFLNFDFATGLMPEATASVAGVLGLWRIAVDTRSYARYRAYKVETSLDNGDRPTALGTPVRSVERAASMPVREGAYATPALEAEALPEMNDEARLSRFPGIRERAWGIHGQFGREMIAIGWLVCLIALCYIIGFVSAVVAFCMLYGITAMGRVLGSLRARIAFAALSAAAMGGLTWFMLNALHLTFRPLLHL